MIQSVSFCMYEFVCFPTCVYLSGSMFLLLRAFIFFPERSLYGEGGGGGPFIAKVMTFKNCGQLLGCLERLYSLEENSPENNFQGRVFYSPPSEWY